MQQNLPLIVLIVGIVIALLVIWYIITRFLVNIGAKEVGIKERRYFGRRMPQGRVVATDGEVGLQADILKPGLHFVMKALKYGTAPCPPVIFPPRFSFRSGLPIHTPQTYVGV